MIIEFYTNMYWTNTYINQTLLSRFCRFARIVQNFIYKYLHDALTVLNLVYATKHNICKTSNTRNNISYRN